ncbi:MULTISPECIES: HD-GYP domain-containing protein [Bacillus]|uniref:HD-GYP domain-containing protein n=1 Tax=Bacillus TaxID=1386 RepID=UPI000309092E|nr:MULTISPECIES: HD-GYP domain-containing protein [Bacillus]
MRLISTNHVIPKSILGKTIYNERNKVLLNEGVVLSESLVTRLIELGVLYVYIEDPKSENINPENTVSERLRFEAIESIESIFLESDKKGTQAAKSYIFEKNSKQLMGLIRGIMKEMTAEKGLLTILADVYTHDSYIFTHSYNVTLYALAIGMELKLNPKQLEILGLGSILHDVGKMKVSQKILLKPGKLTEEEYEEIKTHAEEGFQILKEVNTVPLLVAHCAYQHHERIDGSGYPRGLKDKDIHFFAKILAVADVFDAVTSNRVYRKALLPHEGLEILYSGSGTLFDTEIIEAFRKAVAIYPIGLTVKLNDKRIGIVSKQNHGISDRPVVRIIKDNGNHDVQPYEIDLMKCLDVMIVDCITN